MPRQRRIVTEKISTAELHRVAVNKAIKLYSPYEVVDGELLSQHEDKYYVVFTAPLGGQRKVIAGRNKFLNAVKLKNMLSEAWAEGRCSVGTE